MSLRVLIAIIGLVALVIAAGAYFRLAPLPADRLSETPGPKEPGTYPMEGGLKVVRPLAELPPDALSQMLAIMEASPRTERVGDPSATNPAAFVTRTKIWGFPDIAVIWVEDENLHLYSHLVYGRGDLGVNAARVSRWFDTLGS